MSYANHDQSGMRPAPAVPFSEFTAPMAYIGEAVYTAVEMAAKGIAAAFRAVARVAQRHRTQSQLMTLDDRTLQDIGVSRSEIRYIARRVSEDAGYDFRRYGGL